MTTINLEAVVTAIQSVSTEVIETLQATDVPRACEPHELAVYGAVAMRDGLLSALDVSEFEALETTDLEDHQQRVERFCLHYCPHSRAVGPGMHNRCVKCPLAPLVHEVMAAQVERAFDTD